MVKTKVAWQAKWVSLFLSFSCEPLRTLRLHAGEYLSHSVDHGWNVSRCFKWLQHLSYMVRWRNVRLHRGKEGRWWKDKRGGEEWRGTGVCVHARVCTSMYNDRITLMSVSGNFHLQYVTIIHSDFPLPVVSSSTVSFPCFHSPSDRQTAIHQSADGGWSFCKRST